MSKEYMFSEYAELMRKHQNEAREMAERLIRIPGYEARADRMKNCESYTSGLMCPKCHTFHTIKASLCRDRLCPNCGWALSRKRASAVLQAIEEVAAAEPIEVIHIVLTQRHEQSDEPREQVERLQSACTRLMRRKRMQQNVIGYVRSVEIKKNSSGFHPHVHMLLIVKGEYFRNPIKQRELCSMWRAAGELDYDPIVWIKKAYDGKTVGNDLKSAIYECVKYTIKTSEWKRMNDKDLSKAADAIYHRQLFNIGGNDLRTAYNRALRKQNEYNELETPYCKSCGTKKVIATIGGKYGV